jgi:hypothetical protein
MTAPKARSAPAGLAAAGRQLWRSVAGEYDLERHEELLLREACRTADRLDRLADEAARGPVTVTNAKGDLVAHPAMVEARQQAGTLSRLLASLRLPSGEDSGESRPQRRGAARGAYGVRGVA